MLSDRDNYTASVRSLASVFSPMSIKQERYCNNGDKVRADLAKLLAPHIPNSCFIQLMENKPFPKKKSLPPCPPPLSESSRLVDSSLTGQDLIAAVVKVTSITEADIAAVDASTTAQSSCVEWMRQRHARITASNFYRVCTHMATKLTKPDTQPKSLINSIMGYSPPFTTAATKHGISMEAHAKLAYSKHQKRCHKRFVSSNCGLKILFETQFIAASPDLLVSCACHGDGLCEIKCPYSIRETSPSADNLPYLHSVNGDVKLRTNSNYFFQIQGQMGVTGRKYCDFFVYTGHGYHCERIAFDDEVWENIKEKLCMFWELYIVHELVHRTLKESSVPTVGCDTVSLQAQAGPSDGHHSVLCTNASTSRMKPLKPTRRPVVFMCGVCASECADEPHSYEEESVECSGCKLWVHLQCAGLPSMAPVKGDWYCTVCRV